MLDLDFDETDLLVSSSMPLFVPYLSSIVASFLNYADCKVFALFFRNAYADIISCLVFYLPESDGPLWFTESSIIWLLSVMAEGVCFSFLVLGCEVLVSILNDRCLF